jgi:hypothetical protein
MEEMLNSSDFRALSREENSERFEEFGRIHSHAETRRLDDDKLLSKLELDRKMLASAEPVDCAGFSRGRVSREHLHAMLGQPEVSEIERWYDLIVQAEAADQPRVILRPRQCPSL